MKLRSLVTLSALTLGFAGMTQAATTNFVYFTGSTAFRGAIFDALATNTFDAPGPSIVATKCSGVGSLDPHTAGQMVFSGNISAAPFVVKCAWSGSEAGIGDLTAAVGAGLESFVATGTAGQTNTTTLATPDSHTVDLAMADTDQGVSLTQTPILTGDHVGEIPFVFVKNAQTNGTTLTTPPAEWLALQNVTAAEMRVLLTGGSPLALLTGNPAHTNFVYVAGRDNQSGTFVNTMLDTEFGLVNDPSQIEIASSGGYASINPPNLLSGPGKGVEGQNSGGTLSVSMTLCGSATNTDPIAVGNGLSTSGWYAIAYLGVPDALVCEGIQGPVVAPNGQAIQLTWEGNAESPANVENGTYSFFGNEWMYESAHNLSSGGSTIFTKLEASVPQACDNNLYISLTAMKCVKQNSASDPAHN